MSGPTPSFWQERFEKQETRWDRGAPSPQLLAWLDSGALLPCRIAVPGCGGGWEVAELARRGFEVVGLDYTEAAVSRTHALLRSHDLQAEVVQADVLQHAPERHFDAIYEQTCLCAIHPDHWRSYAAQLHRWLRPGGRLALMGLQVLRPAAATGRIEGPPYHLDIGMLRALLLGDRWDWPAPPYPAVPHPRGWTELAIVLTRR